MKIRVHSSPSKTPGLSPLVGLAGAIVLAAACAEPPKPPPPPSTAPIIESFSATSASVGKGDRVTLRRVVQGAQSVTLSEATSGPLEGAHDPGAGQLEVAVTQHAL